MITAQRCFRAALEHLEDGDLLTAGALFRATGRCIEKLATQPAVAPGEVVRFPLARVCG